MFKLDDKKNNTCKKDILNKSIFNIGKNILLSSLLVFYMPNIADISKKQSNIIPEDKTYKTYIDEQYLKKVKLMINIKIDEMLNEENKKYDKYMHPEKYVNKKEKTLYLTFDDGPSKYTLNVLDILDKHNIKAIFFIVCSKINKSTQHIVDQIVERGHVLANHQEFHRISKSEEDLKKLVGTCKVKIDEIAYYQKEIFFRYPYGAKAKYGNKVLNELGYKADIMWDIDTNDWRFVAGHQGFDKSKFVDYVINKVEKRKNGIVLMHDIHKLTADSLDQIIVTLKNKGYYFDLLTYEDVENKNHVVKKKKKL